MNISHPNAFAPAQERWDHMAEPDRDGPMTEQEAEEIARDEALATPAEISDWLALKMRPEDSEPMDDARFTSMERCWKTTLTIQDASVPELLSALFFAPQDKRWLVISELRLRYLSAKEGEIKSRVLELLKEDAE